MLETYRETQKFEAPRAEEYRRLAELTTQLLAAEKSDDLGVRLKALNENQKFWQGLRLSSVSALNSLPADLRAQFVTLASWVERESVLASLGEAGLSGLIAVNRQIMEGLKPYSGSLAADTLTASA